MKNTFKFLIAFTFCYLNYFAQNKTYTTCSVEKDGKCTGSANCSACKTCNYCAHCNSGGSCGVCKPSLRINNNKVTSSQKIKSNYKLDEGLNSNKINKELVPNIKSKFNKESVVIKKDVKAYTSVLSSGRYVHTLKKGTKVYLGEIWPAAITVTSEEYREVLVIINSEYYQVYIKSKDLKN